MDSMQPRLPEPSPAPVPAHASSSDLTVPSDTPYLDANGYDPADYRWVPVRRKPRADGWSDSKQRDFIEALADSGSVSDAAHAVGMSPSTAYRLRRSPGGEAFAGAWDAAVAQAVGMLVDVAFDRAINGTVEPVLDAEGRRVGSKHRPGDRMLMFLLTAHFPDRYGKQRGRRRKEAVVPTVAEALERLAPVAPAEPEALMPPEEFDVAIEVADMADGRLPGWYDPDRRDEPVRSPLDPSIDPPIGEPLPDHLAEELDRHDDIHVPEPGVMGLAFEVELALAKRGIAVRPPRKRPSRKTRRV